MIEKAFFQAGFSVEKMDWLLMHQANQRILDAVAQRLELLAQEIISNVAKYGNTSVASIPIALDEAIRQFQIKRGDIVAIAGLGSGISWGAAIIELGLAQNDK